MLLKEFRSDIRTRIQISSNTSLSIEYSLKRCSDVATMKCDPSPLQCH